MAMSFGASDLHLRAGSFPVIRINGELRPLSGVERLSQDETLEMAFSMMSNRQKMHFKEAYEVDIGYGVSGLGRFRVNIFQQRNSIGIVARVISDYIAKVSRTRSAADSDENRRRKSRFDSRNRNDRIGKIDDARGDG
jgi:twitching motility protein PilT